MKKFFLVLPLELLVLTTFIGKLKGISCLIISILLLMSLTHLIFRSEVSFMGTYGIIRSLFRKQIKRYLLLPIIGLSFITLIAFLLIGSSSIMITHQSNLLSEKDYSSGHIHIQTNLFGMKYPSELDEWIQKLNTNITNAFLGSGFPANLTTTDVLFVVKLDISGFCYDNQSNIIHVSGSNTLVVSSGIFWQELLNLANISEDNMPHFITFTHDGLNDISDLGNYINFSIVDPFLLYDTYRVIPINNTDTANVHFNSYREMIKFQEKWSLPAFPGQLLVCNFTFFKALFEGENLIIPYNPDLGIREYVEWRGYLEFPETQFFTVDYDAYFTKFQLLIRDMYGYSQLVSIESPFMGAYYSSMVILVDFIYIAAIVVIPIFFFGMFILLLGIRDLAQQKRSFLSWLHEKGYKFSSELLYDSIQFILVSSIGLITGLLIGHFFLSITLAQLGYPLSYLSSSLMAIPIVFGIALQILLLFQIVTNSNLHYQMRQSEGYTMNDQSSQAVTDKALTGLSTLDYIIIIALIIAYALTGFFTAGYLSTVTASEDLFGTSELRLLFSFAVAFFAIFAFFALSTVRKLATMMFVGCNRLLRKFRRINIATKILLHKKHSITLMLVFILLPVAFFHVGYLGSHQIRSYINAVSGVYVGSDFRLEGVDWDNINYQSIFNSSYFKSLSIMHVASDVRDKRLFDIEDFLTVSYHIIGINCTSFVDTAFWDNHIVGLDTSVIKSLTNGQALVSIEAKEKLHKNIDENITLELSNIAPYGPPTYTYSFSIRGFFNHFPGYNNLNDTDAIYDSTSSTLNVVIVVSLSTFQLFQSVFKNVNQLLLIKANKGSFEKANAKLDSMFSEQYSVVKKYQRIDASDIKTIRNIPIFNHIILFMNLQIWISLVMIAVALFLILDMLRRDISPIIVSYHVKGLSANKILTILVISGSIMAVTATILEIIISLAYHFLFMPLLGIFVTTHNLFQSALFSLQELFLWLIYWVAVVGFNIFLMYRIGKRKELVLPRQVI